MQRRVICFSLSQVLTSWYKRQGVFMAPTITTTCLLELAIATLGCGGIRNLGSPSSRGGKDGRSAAQSRFVYYVECRI